MKRLLFIHIPRTAGRSITENGHIMMTNAGHVYADNIKNIENFFSFTFVRNPYDRFLSSYHFYKSIYKGERPIKNEMSKYKSFEDFVLNFDTFKYNNDLQFQPQHKFINDKVDYIGRYEYLKLDWQVLINRSGHDFYSLPHINNTNHWEWEVIYTDKMKDIVYNLFKKDFELFSYDK